MYNGLPPVDIFLVQAGKGYNAWSVSMYYPRDRSHYLIHRPRDSEPAVFFRLASDDCAIADFV